MNSSIRSGKWSLILSLSLIVWLALAAVLNSYSASNDIVSIVAGSMFFASWFIVPVLVVAILVLAVIALLLNPVRGKILAAIAVVAPFVAFVIGVTVAGGFASV